MNSPVAPVSVSLRNILFPTDFSPCSEIAFTYGTALARRFDATLHTVTVVPEEITDYVQPPDPFYLRHTAEKKMASVKSLELLHGIRHREFVKEGVILETLSDLIERLEIDLVVLGNHGRSGAKKFMLGSVAEEIVNSMVCPVFTVGPRVPPLAAPQPKLRRILFATDLLHGSGRALAYALWLAEHEGAGLTLLHVIKTPLDVRSGDPRAEVELKKERLAQLLPPESAGSVEAECIVEMGVPADQIPKVAEDKGAEVIVMGPAHTAFTRISAHLPWITSHKVICYAPCPVLTVRE
jgi:nucleotide-binding universal stress UspA family protein